MKLATFFEKFDEFARTPDAVATMRELILLLSVRGKLSEQFVSESCEPQLAHAHAFAKRKGRAFVPDPPEAPFEIPSNWGWVAVGHSMTLINGTAFKPQDWTPEGTPIVRIQNLNNENAPFNRYSGEIDKKFYIRSGDFLISWSGTPGTSFGAFIWNRGVAILNQHIFRCELLDGVFLKEYLRLAVNARLDEMISRAHGAVGLRHITKGKLESIPLPLPPLAEQKRIVAKVDELMALCDRLEVQQQERDAKHTDLARASLARFADAPTPANLNFLFHKSYTISPTDLRKTILTLAVQGKLVPQDPKDGPEQELLDATSKPEAEKPKWAGPILEQEKPFALPPSWTWARLGDIATLKHGYAFSSSFFTDEPAPFVLTTPGNFYEKGGFRDRESKRKYYSGPVDGDFIFKPRDLIIPMTEQAAGLLGSPAFVPDDGRVYIHNQRLGKISLSASIAPEYAFHFFNSEFFRGELARTSTGMKVRHTSPDRVLRVPFPVCPLAEQRRIVAKVDQLMALVDQLENQLSNSHATAEKLMEALVAELTTRRATTS